VPPRVGAAARAYHGDRTARGAIGSVRGGHVRDLVGTLTESVGSLSETRKRHHKSDEREIGVLALGHARHHIRETLVGDEGYAG